MPLDDFAAASLITVPLARIHEWPDNPRRTHSPVKHAELVASIRSDGLLQPLLVRPRPDGDFEVICGNRRRRALVEIAADGDITVAVMVRNLDDDSACAAALKENGDRDDLAPLDEARAYQRLADSHTVDNVALLVGKSATHVRNRLRLLDLVPLAQWLIERGLLPMAAALVLAQVRDHREQVRVIVDLGYNVTAIDDAFDAPADDLEGRLTQVTVADLDGLSVKDPIEPHDGVPPLKAWRDQVAGAKRELGDARFPIADERLPGGSCLACPKRTGAQGALFGELVDDTCLDAKCWDRKMVVHGNVLMDAASRRGKLIPIDGAHRFFATWGSPKALTWDGPWADAHGLDLTPEERAQVHVVVDPDGLAREVVARKVADAVIQRTAEAEVAANPERWRPPAGDGTPSEPSAAQKKKEDQRRREEADRVASAKTEVAVVDAITEEMTAFEDGRTFALVMALAVAAVTGAQAPAEIARLKKLSDIELIQGALRRLISAVYLEQKRRDLLRELLTTLDLEPWETFHEIANPPTKKAKKQAGTAASHRVADDDATPAPKKAKGKKGGAA